MANPCEISICLPSRQALGGRFPAADGRHDSATWPSIWPTPSALPPYSGTSEGIGFPGIDSLGYWSW